MADSTPTKERGETLREAANILRGMLLSGRYTPDQLPEFIDNLARANDILVDEATSLMH